MSKIDKVLQYGVHESSLDVGIGEDQETSLADILADDRASSPEARLLDQQTATGLGQIYGQLSYPQRRVIAYRYGVAGRTPLTLQETGERIGVSRERVRQIENQATQRMRKLFAKRRRIQRFPRSSRASGEPRPSAVTQ